MVVFKVVLLPFEHSDPTYLPITQVTAELLVRAWESHDGYSYVDTFQDALEEAGLRMTRHTARDRLFENTCIVIEDEVEALKG